MAGKNGDLIACVQETYLTNELNIPYLWRGNFHLTPGLGNAQGCITFLSSHINVIERKDVNNRAHVLACQKSGEVKVSFIIANVYAPNPNNSEKLDFFEAIFETIMELETRHDCTNTLVVGDFNVTFSHNESKNRFYSMQEQRVAMAVKDLMNEASMSDIWEQGNSFTWRRANSDTFSTIDRILFNKESLKVCTKRTNWALSFSDHAAVEASFELNANKPKTRTRIRRLDATLIKLPDCKEAIEKGYHEMMDKMPDNWNPHLKLEYAKMCLRTVVEKVQAERKRFETNEEESINEELNNAVSSLAAGTAIGGPGGLIDYIEELRGRKAQLVEERGNRLAEKVKTKWYNEGEKSSKYFLGLLKRKIPDDFKSLTDNSGNVLTDPELVEKEIVDFYKRLYENKNKMVIEEEDNFLNELTSIAAEEADAITRPMTATELGETLQTCSDSSPGPDGIPYSLLGLVWSSYGKLLSEAWAHSLRTGNLPTSHKASYLKLIPKEGKDLSKLTNWRPITLSNCDHKLITKSYSIRMCNALSSVIGETQTAYLKGRLINDNIRAMLGSINIAGEEEDIDGIIVSLDAKKAFDSVDHRYIERCLERFGCTNFVPIFRILYSDLTTDIMINGTIVKGFRIRRGVKQGDALSCILFIMCMEPLIRNIDSNQDIRAIESTSLNNSLPKTYAYADDINCVVSVDSLQLIFNEYERLTKNSGLQLNADKTELMLIGKRVIERAINVQYMGVQHRIETKVKIKINGIIFQRNYSALVEDNLSEAMKKMDKHFRSWSRRGLTTLGKILILKTFGISQLIYLFQSVVLGNNDYKTINKMLYKFVWNRHYLAAKAPERIKRNIMITKIKEGGLGILDIAELDSSL